MPRWAAPASPQNLQFLASITLWPCEGMEYRNTRAKRYSSHLQEDAAALPSTQGTENAQQRFPNCHPPQNPAEGFPHPGLRLQIQAEPRRHTKPSRAVSCLVTIQSRLPQQVCCIQGPSRNRRKPQGFGIKWPGAWSQLWTFADPSPFPWNLLPLFFSDPLWGASWAPVSPSSLNSILTAPHFYIFKELPPYHLSPQTHSQVREDGSSLCSSQNPMSDTELTLKYLLRK